MLCWFLDSHTHTHTTLASSPLNDGGGVGWGVGWFSPRRVNEPMTHAVSTLTLTLTHTHIRVGDARVQYMFCLFFTFIFFFKKSLLASGRRSGRNTAPPNPPLKRHVKAQKRVTGGGRRSGWIFKMRFFSFANTHCANMMDEQRCSCTSRGIHHVLLLWNACWKSAHALTLTHVQQRRTQSHTGNPLHNPQAHFQLQQNEGSIKPSQVFSSSQPSPLVALVEDINTRATRFIHTTHNAQQHTFFVPLLGLTYRKGFAEKRECSQRAPVGHLHQTNPTVKRTRTPCNCADITRALAATCQQSQRLCCSWCCCCWR